MKQHWSVLIDAELPKSEDECLFLVFDRDLRKEYGDYNDYEFLESIDVFPSITKYKSINGCLLDADGKLILAPKMKRTSALTKDNRITRVVKSYGIEDWNVIQSKAIRTNFVEFIKHNDYTSQHKKFFEDLLMLYKENLFENVFSVLPTHRIDANFNVNNVPIDKIILSDKVIMQH